MERHPELSAAVVAEHGRDLHARAERRRMLSPPAQAVRLARVRSAWRTLW